MIFIRKNHRRGKTKTDWLDSNHSFSFGEYYDPEFMGFGHVRVINEDTVQPGQGFGRHPHRDMEIISYIVEGSLEHQDSIGTGSIIKPGEIQIMSAGTGILHSEFNHSKSEIVHFLQIWIIPNKIGIKPRYDQKTITKIPNKLILIAAPDQSSAAVIIHQQVTLYVAFLEKNQTISHEFIKDHLGWLQLIKGEVIVNDQPLSAGDGAAISDEKMIHLTATATAEFLLFDMARD